MRRALTLGLLLVSACTGSSAERPRRPEGPGPGSAGMLERKTFAELDVNKDELIDGEEFALLSRKLFVRLDTDGDGNLSAEEYARLAERPAGPPGGMRRGRGPGSGGPPGGPPNGPF